MRKLIALITMLLITGCGTLDGLRGHNIQMAREALTAIKEPIDREYEEKKDNAETPEELAEIEKQHESATYDMRDLERRLNVAQRDFPPPKTPKGEKPIKRTTLTNISEEDEFRFDAYSGLVAKRQARRKFWLTIREQLEKVAKVWDWTIWGLTVAIYVIIAIIVYVVVRKLRWLYDFLSNLLDELDLDKDAKRRLAGGTPVEGAYRKKQNQKYRKTYKRDNQSSTNG